MNMTTTSTQLRRLIATTILAALAAGFTGISAASDSDVRSVTVKFGDLDLSSPQGATALYSRIARAARAVCELPESSLWAISKEHACIDKAVADAVTKVGEPQLIAVYNARNARALPVTVATAQR